MKNVLKHEMPELNKVPEGFLLEQKESGLVGLVEPTREEWENMQKWASMVWDMLGDTVNKFRYPIFGLYLYDHRQCNGDFSICEGICSNQENTETGMKRSIIGIDIEPARRGGEYLAFLLLHEAVHAATGIVGHDNHFHQYLDYLIVCFNGKFGTQLANDYN